MPPNPVDDQQALALLNAVANAPTPTAVRAFDAYFYDLVRDYIRRRHRFLGSQVAAATGATNNPAPPLSADRLEEAVHITATIALSRARASAGRFDPAKGRAVMWVYRAAIYAYVEVAQTFAEEQSELLTDAEARAVQARPSGRPLDDPAELVASQDLVDDLFLALTDDERAAFILRTEYGFSYAEIAEVMLGTAGQTKRVDYLLQRARAKLIARYTEFQQRTVGYTTRIDEDSR